MTLLRISIWTLFSVILIGACPLCGQVPATGNKKFPLWNFDEVGCRAKGRLQDKEYCRSHVMDEILAQKEAAIPVLISQLTDERLAREPIFDYWNQMTIGDIAGAILNSLFTDADGSTFTMPGLQGLGRGCKNKPAEQCWHNFVREHGMKFVQQQWLAAWNANRTHIYWDANERCFRASKDS